MVNNILSPLRPPSNSQNHYNHLHCTLCNNNNMEEICMVFIDSQNIYISVNGINIFNAFLIPCGFSIQFYFFLFVLFFFCVLLFSVLLYTPTHPTQPSHLFCFLFFFVFSLRNFVVISIVIFFRSFFFFLLGYFRKCALLCSMHCYCVQFSRALLLLS